MTLPACAPSTATLAPEVSLPQAPAYMAPVRVPEVHEGDDAVVALVEHRAALGKANSRLRASRAYYDRLRARYGGGAK